MIRATELSSRPSITSRIHLLKRVLKQYVAPSIALAAVGLGCASKEKPAATSLSARLRPNASVTAIAPTPPAPTPPAYSTPAYSTPADSTPISSTPAGSPATSTLPNVVGGDGAAAASFTPAAGASAGGSTYVVRKGDTLFKIARDRYGDPKAWKRIAAANPSASGGVIKAGQKLVLP